MENNKELIQTIEIKLNTTIPIYDNGIMPWINLGDYIDYLPDLIDADELVLAEKELSITIEYPLANPLTFELKSDTGFTRSMLVEKIGEKYLEIFIEEEELIAKNGAEGGKYGIWGHSLYDLDLVSIMVYKTNEGKTQLLLNVDS